MHVGQGRLVPAIENLELRPMTQNMTHLIMVAVIDSLINDCWHSYCLCSFWYVLLVRISSRLTKVTNITINVYYILKFALPVLTLVVTKGVQFQNSLHSL